MEDGIDALSFLGFVVLQGADRDTGQQQDHNDIDDGFDAHGDIRQAPGHGDIVLRADEYHHGSGNAENGHKGFVLADKADIGLSIEIIADNGSKGKHAYGDGDDMDGSGTELRSNRLLDQGDAVKGAVGLVNAGEQQDEDGCGTDHQGVDVNGDDLGQALFGRMRNFRGRRCIRHRSHTGLIGEESALDTVDHTGTGKAAKDRPEVESRSEDRCKDCRNLTDIQDDDQKTHDDVHTGHHGNHDR